MPLEQSPYLHSDECTNLIRALKKCHNEHFYRKFLGYCSDVHRDMHNCLKQERMQRRIAHRTQWKANMQNS